MFVRTATAVCFVTSFCAAALAETPATEAPTEPAQSSDSMEKPAVGDYWTYETRDEITGVLKFTNTITITDVTATEIAVRIEWPGKPNGYAVYDHSWNLKKSGGNWKFSPDDGTGVKLPLKVGNSWNFRGDDLDSVHGNFFKRSGSSKVVAMESVTTSAGTFDTFKIETSVTIRNASDTTKKYESIRTTWYAPSINHWAKQTAKFVYSGRTSENTSNVLVDYGRR